MAARRHIVLIAGLLAASIGLAGCADGFDMDKLDVFGLSEKPKLPGERKPVFPEGVPGVSQGIPPELIKGHHPDATDTLNTQTAAVPPAATEQPKAEPKPAAKPRAKAKPKPKPKVVRTPAGTPPQATTTAPSTSQQNAQQASQSSTPASSGTQAPWPSPAPSGSNAPWPSTATGTTTAPWPDAPPPGTFSR